MARQFPIWYLELLQMSEKERESLVNDLLHSISCYNSTNHTPTKEGKNLVTMLKKQCVLQGFSPEILYTKGSGKTSDLKDTFCHRWGYPTLLYKHKILPIVIQVNPGLRRDTMVLSEIPGNRGSFDGVYVVGITG